MTDFDALRAEHPEQGFQFPGVFEVTAIGHADADLVNRVPEIIAAAGVSVIAGAGRVRPSREGNYVSVSVTFTCPDRTRYDAVHAALRASDGVRWTL
ncbi:MAG: DUF493 family protein [Lysobacterales bacterium]